MLNTYRAIRRDRAHRKWSASQRGRTAARGAGLRYVDDSLPGITRLRRGGVFEYAGPSGRVVGSRRALERIRSLAIPPAWTDVWICPEENGHIQATGRDARGRKQYRYHPRWREQCDVTKYERMMAFARALPRMRKRIDRNLRRRGLPREKVLAAVVRLLETALIRVGNEEYARKNHSFGLTTLHNKHAEVRGSKIRFDFLGKSGIEHEVIVRDPRLARIVRQCQHLPGQELFEYVDESGHIRDVRSEDVNQYLREISGEDFTAKDFRTWAGTALATRALQKFKNFDTKAAAKRNVTLAIEIVADRLGNTTAVCRKSYVHPVVIEAYYDRALAMPRQRMNVKLRKSPATVVPAETAILELLQKRMHRQPRGPARKPQCGTAKRLRQKTTMRSKSRRDSFRSRRVNRKANQSPTPS